MKLSKSRFYPTLFPKQKTLMIDDSDFFPHLHISLLFVSQFMEKNKTKMTFFSFKTFFHVVVVVVVSVKMFHIIKYAHLNESFSPFSHPSADNEASMQSNMTTSYFIALTRTSVK
jgi:hypothetical protein